MTDSVRAEFTVLDAHKEMFVGLLELVSWLRQKHCECSVGCYRLELQCVDREMDFEGGMTVGNPNELLLSKMSFSTKYHRVPTGSGGVDLLAAPLVTVRRTSFLRLSSSRERTSDLGCAVTPP